MEAPTLTKVSPKTLLNSASLRGDHGVAVAREATVIMSRVKILAANPASTTLLARFFPVELSEIRSVNQKS
ncbi:MAG: hypothetical protein U5L09_07515 [Bacteroidales bacterium]|nr:hypothetical protein [Bacteroidales bacterium]